MIFMSNILLSEKQKAILSFEPCFEASPTLFNIEDIQEDTVISFRGKEYVVEDFAMEEDGSFKIFGLDLSVSSEERMSEFLSVEKDERIEVLGRYLS